MCGLLCAPRLQSKTAELVFELNAFFSKCWCHVHVTAQAGWRCGLQSVTAAVPRFEPPCGRVLDVAAAVCCTPNKDGTLAANSPGCYECCQDAADWRNAADAATHTCASCFPACNYAHPGVLADDLEHSFLVALQKLLWWILCLFNQICTWEKKVVISYYF